MIRPALICLPARAQAPSAYTFAAPEESPVPDAVTGIGLDALPTGPAAVMAPVRLMLGSSLAAFALNDSIRALLVR